MPTYVFINKLSGEKTEHVMKIAELDAFKQNNPQLERFMGLGGVSTDAPVDPTRLGRVKIDNGFREVLQKIADRTPGGQGLRDNIR